MALQEFGGIHTDTQAQSLIDWRVGLQLQKHGASFNPQDFYTVSRRPHRRSALQAVSRDYEVTFFNLESQIDKNKLIFGHVLSSLIQELQLNLENFSHILRLFLHDPSLSFTIHISFQDHDDLVVNLVEISVVNLVEYFIRISSRNGVKDIGDKNKRTTPDLRTFMRQKRSVVRIIETDNKNCLVSALAIGHERISEAAHGARTKKKKFLP